MCIVWCRSSQWVEVKIRGVYKRDGYVRSVSLFYLILLYLSSSFLSSHPLFFSWLTVYFSLLFKFHREDTQREREMVTNIAHTLRSLRPEASALLMDNLGLASVGESPPQVLRRQSQQTCDAGILGHNGRCVPESSCMFVNSPSSFSSSYI